jgi:site-specific DNA recombinase
MAGKVCGGRSIAEKIGLDEPYVSQILECGFLAPDIVEAILDGRQPSNLTGRKLTRRVPMNWGEQRKKLGFPNVSSR